MRSFYLTYDLYTKVYVLHVYWASRYKNVHLHTFEKNRIKLLQYAKFEIVLDMKWKVFFKCI